MKNKKIVVIGGNGYLGHHVAKYFSADRLSRKNGFDITKDIGSILDPYEVIIHMTALIDKNGKKYGEAESFRVNRDGTKNLVSRLNPSQTLIFASTKEIHDATECYGKSKLEAEKEIELAARERGFKYGIFRMSTTYAPSTNGSSFINHFVNSVKGGLPLKLQLMGEQTRDPLYVEDLARAFEKFINSDLRKGVYEIGSGKTGEISFKELVYLIGEVIGKSPNLELLPGPEGKIDRFSTDITLIKKELKWTPKISLREGIRRLSLN